MGLVTAVRDRLSTQRGGDAAHGEPSNGNGPVPGYGRLKERDVVRELSQHSQAELAAIEEYERAHKNRGPVLAKLRYLRGREPLRDYDAISAEELSAMVPRSLPAWAASGPAAVTAQVNPRIIRTMPRINGPPETMCEEWVLPTSAP